MKALLLAIAALALSTLGPVDLHPHCDRLAPLGYAVAMAAQDPLGPPPPAPGNPGHEEPAPGSHCARAGDPGVDAAHACACHHTCKPNTETDEDGNVTTVPGEHLEENAQCRVYCFKNACRCPPENCE